MKIGSGGFGVAFLTYRPANEGGVLWSEVPTMGEAHGVRLLCPCGEHFIAVWDQKVHSEAKPEGRWQMSGTTLDDLTLGPIEAPEAQPIPTGCGRNVVVVNGEIELV